MDRDHDDGGGSSTANANVNEVLSPFDSRNNTGGGGGGDQEAFSQDAGARKKNKKDKKKSKSKSKNRNNRERSNDHSDGQRQSGTSNRAANSQESEEASVRLQTMWRVAVARRRLRAIITVVPRLQAAVRAWKVRANIQAVHQEAERQRRAAITRKQRRLRIEHQRRELELLKAMKGRSEHVVHVQNLRRNAAARRMQRWMRARQQNWATGGRRQSTTQHTAYSAAAIDLAHQDDGEDRGPPEDGAFSDGSNHDFWYFRSLPDADMSVELQVLLQGPSSANNTGGAGGGAMSPDGTQQPASPHSTHEDLVINQTFVRTAIAVEASEADLTVNGTERVKAATRSSDPAADSRGAAPLHSLVAETDKGGKEADPAASERTIAAHADKLRWELRNSVNDLLGPDMPDAIRATPAYLQSVEGRAKHTAMLANFLSDSAFQVTKDANIWIEDGVLKSNSPSSSTFPNTTDTAPSDQTARQLRWPVKNVERSPFLLTAAQELRLQERRRNRRTLPGVAVDGSIHVDFSEFLDLQANGAQQESGDGVTADSVDRHTGIAPFDELVDIHDQRIFASELFGGAGGDTATRDAQEGAGAKTGNASADEDDTATTMPRANPRKEWWRVYCPTTQSRDKSTGQMWTHPTSVIVADVRRAFGVPAARKATSTAARIEPSRHRWGFPADWAQWETPWQFEPGESSTGVPSPKARPKVGAEKLVDSFLNDHAQNKASLTWLKHCSGDAELWQKAQDMQRELEQGLMSENPWDELDQEYSQLKDQVLNNAKAARLRADAKRYWAAKKIQAALRRSRNKVRKKKRRAAQRELRMQEKRHGKRSDSPKQQQSQPQQGRQPGDAALEERARAFAEFQLFWEWKESQKFKPRQHGHSSSRPATRSRSVDHGATPNFHRTHRSHSRSHRHRPSETSFQLEVDDDDDLPVDDREAELNYSRLDSDSDADNRSRTSAAGAPGSQPEMVAVGEANDDDNDSEGTSLASGLGGQAGFDAPQDADAIGSKGKVDDVDNLARPGTDNGSIGGSSYETPPDTMAEHSSSFVHHKSPLTTARKQASSDTTYAQLRQSWIRNKHAELGKPLDVGTPVQWTLSYAGRTELFHGIVHAVHINHEEADGAGQLFTYDIEYPDGDVEYGVLPFLVSPSTEGQGGSGQQPQLQQHTTNDGGEDDSNGQSDTLPPRSGSRRRHQRSNSESSSSVDQDEHLAPPERAVATRKATPSAAGTQQDPNHPVDDQSPTPASGKSALHIGTAVRITRAHREGTKPEQQYGFVTQLRANGKIVDVHLHDGEQLPNMPVSAIEWGPHISAAGTQSSTEPSQVEGVTSRFEVRDSGIDSANEHPASDNDLQVGERILCRRKGVFSPAVVASIGESPNRLFGIIFPELRLEEQGVERQRIMKTDGKVGPIPEVGPDMDTEQLHRDGASRARPISDKADFRVRDRVECNFQERGKWFRATIQSCEWDDHVKAFSYSVAYDDGDWEDGIFANNIRRIVLLRLSQERQGNAPGTTSNIRKSRKAAQHGKRGGDGRVDKEHGDTARAGAPARSVAQAAKRDVRPKAPAHGRNSPGVTTKTRPSPANTASAKSVQNQSQPSSVVKVQTLKMQKSKALRPAPAASTSNSRKPKSVAKPKSSAQLPVDAEKSSKPSAPTHKPSDLPGSEGGNRRAKGAAVTQQDADKKPHDQVGEMGTAQNSASTKSNRTGGTKPRAVSSKEDSRSGSVSAPSGVTGDSERNLESESLEPSADVISSMDHGDAASGSGQDLAEPVSSSDTAVADSNDTGNDTGESEVVADTSNETDRESSRSLSRNLQRSVNAVDSDEEEDNESQATEEFQGGDSSSRNQNLAGTFDMNDSRFSFALDQTGDSMASSTDGSLAVSRTSSILGGGRGLGHVPEDRPTS